MLVKGTRVDLHSTSVTAVMSPLSCDMVLRYNGTRLRICLYVYVCVCVYACACTYVHVHVHVYVYVYAYACICICVCVHMHMCMHTCMRMRAFAYVHVYVYVYAYAYVYVYVYVYVHVYVYVYAYVYIYIYMYMYMRWHKLIYCQHNIRPIFHIFNSSSGGLPYFWCIEWPRIYRHCQYNRRRERLHTMDWCGQYHSDNEAFRAMTSSNGNIFRVTGPLCWEFTGHRWITHTKASDADLWYFLWSAPE